MGVDVAELEVDKEIGIREAKNSLSQLVAAVRKGEEVYLMNRGERVAKLVPVHAPVAADPTHNGRGMFKNKIHLPAGWATQKAREEDEKGLLKTIEGL